MEGTEGISIQPASNVVIAGSARGLLNFRRPDFHTVAAAQADKLDKLIHARRCGIRCAAARAYFLRADFRRSKQASLAALPDFRRQRFRIA